jgi:hypothetical protein
MHMRPGLEVIRLGFRGKGQVTRVKDGMCQVLWSGGKRDSHPQSELVWVGLHVHAHGAVPGRVISLGREKVQVRLSDGKCCWLNTNEFEPRHGKQEVAPEQ